MQEYAPFPNVERRNRLQERVEVPALIRSLRLPAGVSILEVGCGRGVALPPLAELCRPRRLIGLDVDLSLLGEARRRLEGRGMAAELVHGDVRSMPFPDASVDVVVDFGTCWHIADAERALREIERVLAPGGRFVHETVLSQRLAHPVRSRRGGLPWSAAPRLERERTAILWSARRAAV